MAGSRIAPEGLVESSEESLDVLAGHWRIFQLRGGHRFSTDDLLTAWAAARARAGALRLLDLGAGIGSVGLLVLWRLPGEARLTMVEVQELSQRLAQRTVARNGLVDRVKLHLADLRTWSGDVFDLVTGSPPYLPPSCATCSRHPQRAAARIELHGDVFDYCRAAARSLDDGGVFCFCHAASDPRPEAAIEAAGLRLLRRQPVHFRARLPASIALYTCAWRGERDDPPPLFVRDASGRWTEEYLAVREEMGAPASFLERVRLSRAAPASPAQPAADRSRAG